MTLTAQTRFAISAGARMMPFDSANGKSYLAILPDGKQFQLTDKLFALVGCLDEPRTIDGVAHEFQRRTGFEIATNQVEQIFSNVVVPRGLVTIDDGNLRPELHTSQAVMLGSDASQTQVSAVNPANNEASASPSNGRVAGMHVRKELLTATQAEKITRLFSILFHSWLALPILVLIAVAHGLTYVQLGWPPKMDLLQATSLFALGLLLVSMFAHELGHLSACKRWECPHGGLGVGFYLIAPVFYADVTQAWRLSRWQRVCVDLGGIYFQLFFGSVVALAGMVTHQTWLSFVLFFVDLFVLMQFDPFAKMDGYWLVSDAGGIPNLHKRTLESIRTVAAKLMRRNASEAPPFANLNKQARVILSLYATASVLCWPLILFFSLPSLVSLVTEYPSMLQQASVDVAVLAKHLQWGEIATVILGLAIPTLMVVGVALFAQRLLQFLIKAIAQHVTRPAAPQSGSDPIGLGAKILSFGMVVGLLVVACTYGQITSKTASSLPAQPELNTNNELKIGALAPAFNAIDVGGNSIKFEAFRGKRIVLHFWSPDCVPCQREIPGLNKSYSEIRNDDSIVFLSIASRYPKDQLGAFVREKEILYPVLMDEDGSLSKLYGVYRIPFTYFLDKTGQVARADVGYEASADLTKKVADCDATGCTLK